MLKEGDKFKAGDMIAEVMTDKVRWFQIIYDLLLCV